MMNKVEIAKAYYQAVDQGSVDDVRPYLHPDVCLISPLVTLEGPAAVVEGSKRFGKIVDSITLRSTLESADQVAFVHDVRFSAPFNCDLPAVELLTFKDNKIAKIEFFYDASIFKIKKEREQ